MVSVVGVRMPAPVMMAPPTIRGIAIIIALCVNALCVIALCVLGPALAKISPARADQTVNLDLVLAIDASGTVDPAEFDLQTRGLADAFRHPEVIAAILSALDLDTEALLAAARSPENKQRLAEQTAEAGRLGIFGAPTLVVANELFWGGDRIDAALERARAKEID